MARTPVLNTATPMSVVIFALLLLAGFGFFTHTMMSMVRAAARGSAEPRPRLDQLPARVASVLIYFFGQKKVAQEGPMHRTSKHHLWIFWGFLVITIGTAETIVSGVIPAFSLEAVLPGGIAGILRWAIDLMNLVVLVLVGWAMFRRVAIRPSLIPMNLDAAVILGAIASLMITHFLAHGFAGAVAMSDGHALHSGAPVSNVIAEWMYPMSKEGAQFGRDASYWIHVVLVLAFMNYLPYSKHIHLLGALPNIFLRNLSDRKMDLPKLDLEDENQWGVGRYEQFTWKSLVDNYACTECARCSNYCPAYNTDKNLSPMQLVHDIRYEMLDRDALQTKIEGLDRQKTGFEAKASAGHGGEAAYAQQKLDAVLEEIKTTKGELDGMLDMVGGRIQESTLWACTTCGACQEVCPVFIEHPAQDHPDAPELWFSNRKRPRVTSDAYVPQHRTAIQSVGHLERKTHGMGRGPRCAHSSRT